MSQLNQSTSPLGRRTLALYRLIRRILSDRRLSSCVKKHTWGYGSNLPACIVFIIALVYSVGVPKDHLWIWSKSLLTGAASIDLYSFMVTIFQDVDNLSSQIKQYHYRVEVIRKWLQKHPVVWLIFIAHNSHELSKNLNIFKYGFVMSKISLNSLQPHSTNITQLQTSLHKPWKATIQALSTLQARMRSHSYSNKRRSYSLLVIYL